jgi:hypothetical protein
MTDLNAMKLDTIDYQIEMIDPQGISWRAPDARPTVVEPVAQETVEIVDPIPLKRRSARPRFVTKRRTRW